MLEQGGLKSGDIVVKTSDALGNVIDPATEDKQDDIITGVKSNTNLEGGGKVSVGTTAVEVTFSGATKSVIISADPANTGTLYVGKANVTNAGANALCFLQSGESVTIDYDDATNAIYVVASAASQNFWKGSLI